MTRARVQAWKELEKKLVKRISNVHKQMDNVKKLVSQKQQAELEMRNDIDQIGDVMSKQVELRLQDKSNNESILGAVGFGRKKYSHSQMRSQKEEKKLRKKRQVSDIDTPLRYQQNKSTIVTSERTPLNREISSPRSYSKRSRGSIVQSPQGSIYENQLKLDLIEEEEKIDEMLSGTHNFWTRDVERNEKNYEKQEVMGLEQTRIELISQCAKLEHEIEFLNKLDKCGKQFLQTGKPSNIAQDSANQSSKLRSISR